MFIELSVITTEKDGTKEAQQSELFNTDTISNVFKSENGTVVLFKRKTFKRVKAYLVNESYDCIKAILIRGAKQ